MCVDLLPATVGTREDRGGFSAGGELTVLPVVGLQVVGKDCHVTIEINPGVEELVIEIGDFACEGHQVFLDSTVVEPVRQPRIEVGCLIGKSLSVRCWLTLEPRLHSGALECQNLFESSCLRDFRCRRTTAKNRDYQKGDNDMFHF